MSMTTIDKIEEAVARRPAQLADIRAAGGVVAGYFCCNIPEELVLAAGLVPVRLGRGGDDQLVELGGRYISHQNCPFVRQNVGVFAENTDPYAANADVVVVAATCPQVYRLAEVIEHFFDRRVEIVGVPRNFTSPEGQEYFRAEFADLARNLSDLSGTEITEERLRASIDLLADIRSSIRELYRLQAAPTGVVTWREAFEAVQAGFHLDRVEYAALLHELVDEARTKSAAVTEVDDRPRLFLSGTVIPPGDRKLIDIIEELGARIVGDDLCTGLRPALSLHVKEASIESVADAYLDRVPCAALPHLTLEGDRRLENIKSSYEEFAADGLVYHSLRYCDPITFKATETKRVLGKSLPFIEIHTEYASSDTEGIRTRIGAFIEMIEGARGRREQLDVSRNA